MKTQKGLTLIEILIATSFIFVLVISGYYIISKIDSNNKIVVQEDEEKTEEQPEAISTSTQPTTTDSIVDEEIIEEQETEVIERIIIKEAPAPTSEPGPTAEEDVAITSVQATPTYNSVTIKWKTNIDSTGYVTNFPAPLNYEGNFSASSNIPSKYHEVTIVNLSSSSEYEYNVTVNAGDSSDFTETKTYTTSYDLIKPSQTGVSYSANGGVTISLSFDEPVTYIASAYFNSPSNTKKFVLTENYKSYANLYMPYSESGHTQYMVLYYTVIIYDESGNSRTYNANIELRDIPGYK